MLLEKELAPPDSVRKREEKQARRVEAFLKNKNLKLSASKLEGLGREVSRKYESWKRQTGPLQRRLVRWNDILEGVVEETNFPFTGASNMTLHYAAGMARSFKSTFNKTMYQDEDLAMAVVEPGAQIDPRMIENLTEGFNYLISTKYKIIDKLKDMTIPLVRDGTAVLAFSWDRVVETAQDFRIYASPADFVRDYPTAAIAGVSDDEYKRILNHFIADAENEVRVSFEYKFVKHDGISAEISSLAHTIVYPTFMDSIDAMEMYGAKYRDTLEYVKREGRAGRFYESSVSKVVKLKNAGSTDGWDRSLAFAQGITQGDDKDRPVELCDLVLKYDMDDDGIPEKYLITFAPESKAVLSVRKYDIRRNIDNAVDFRLVKRENRFYGNSLVGDCEDLFNQMDSIVRHENNVSMLTSSPVFIGNSTYKDQLDFGRSDSIIRPGLTLWVEESSWGKAITQLPIQNLEMKDNLGEYLGIYTRFVELLWGPTQGLSGKQTIDDPRSPARKTAMLLTQANQRMDDMMDTFRGSMRALFDIIAALTFQYYGDSQIEIEKGGKKISFPVALLADERIHWEPKRRSVSLTPEFAMARLEALLQTYVNLKPLIMQGDPIAIEVWNRQVVNSGEPDSSKFMIDVSSASAIMQHFKMMQEMMIQRGIDLKAELKGKQSFQAAIGKVTGEKAAEAGLANLSGLTGPGSGIPGPTQTPGNPGVPIGGAQG